MKQMSAISLTSEGILSERKMQLVMIDGGDGNHKKSSIAKQSG